MGPGTSGNRFLLGAHSRTTRKPRIPPVPMPPLHLAPPYSPRSYLEIRDGRREGPEERETTALSQCTHPLWALTLPSQAQVPRARGLSDDQTGFQCPARLPGMYVV